jgi:hypothetical protein
MPRSSRRRRRPRGRGVGQSVLIGIAIAVTAILVAGSLIAVHTQSRGYRTATTTGYAALADRVAQESTRTGALLSDLMAGAPALANQALPHTARGILEQGLDAAVLDTGTQSRQARNLASPSPEGGLSGRFTDVMDLRASATAALRSTVDRLLGMQPLPVAGGPSNTLPGPPVTLISPGQAASEMAGEGRSFEQADADFRALRATAAVRHLPFRVQPSVWVPAPVATAPLGSASLGATAAALHVSVPLFPYHHLVVTTVGLSPPAVPVGGVGSVSTSCEGPVSTVPGATPAVIPPTASLTALVTVTNCGTVPEAGVTVSVTVAVADTAGTAPPPAGDLGGKARGVVSLASGSSSVPDLAPLPVASGHRYTVTVAVSIPPGQLDASGSTQQLLVTVSA